MRKKLNIVKFEASVPRRFRFEFDSPVPTNGNFGKLYLYGVFSDVCSNAGFYATEKLNNILQTIGNLRGRWLEIEKKMTDSGKSYWIVRENGEEITPSDDTIKDYVDSLEKKDQVQEDIDDLRMRVGELESAVNFLSGGRFC